MEHIREITVDLSGEPYFSYITAVQGDEHSRYVKVRVLSGGLPFDLPGRAMAVIRVKKPDGYIVINDAVINSDGTVTAELTETMISAVGVCRCEISIYADGASITSVPFIVRVTEGNVPDDIESRDEFKALTEALNRVNEIDNVADAALENATNAFHKMTEIESEINEYTAAANSAAEKANSAATRADAARETIETKLANGEFKGEKGDPGTNTPQKGVDYFTEEDINEIVERMPATTDYMPYHGYANKKLDELIEPGYYLNTNPKQSDGYPNVVNAPCIIEVLKAGVFGWQKVVYPTLSEVYIRFYIGSSYGASWSNVQLSDVNT